MNEPADRAIAGLGSRLVVDALGVSSCHIYLLEEGAPRLVLAGATPSRDVDIGTLQLAVGEEIAGLAALRREGVRAARDADLPADAPPPRAAALAVPMPGRAGDVVGALEVQWDAASRPGEPDERLLGDLAVLLAGAIENARLQRRLAEHEVALERFARHTIDLQERERRLLAAEIHDGVAQRLVSLTYRLSAAQDALAEPLDPARGEIDAARTLASDALTEVRAAIRGLRPPLLDDLGLGACLARLADDLPPGLDADVDVAPCDLDEHVETTIYRIAQEALQNVVRHARASAVRISLERVQNGVRLVLVDDGIGFDPTVAGREPGSASFGLEGMRARADLIGAELVLVSRPGRGTVVTLDVPSPASSAQDASGPPRAG